MKKIDILRAYIKNEDWEHALALAATFPRLGEYKKEIVRAHEAYSNPRFYISLHKDIDQLKQAGITALLDRYC